MSYQPKEFRVMQTFYYPVSGETVDELIESFDTREAAATLAGQLSGPGKAIWIQER